MIWAWWGWEPLPFYLHYQKKAPGILNPTEDELKKWYRLIHEETTVRAAAEIGINCIATHFVKGFGLKHEIEDIRLTTDLVKKCHRHGIRVFGYLQYGSIFHETFFQDCPDAENWIQRNEDGTPVLWCSQKTRYTPCINSADFLLYLKERIRQGILEVGLDGLHFDNFYSRPCYCPRCREDYRRATGKELPGEQLVAQSPYSPEVRQWVSYRCAQLRDRMIEIRDYARSLKPDIMTIWNPSPIRGLLDQRLLRSTDFRELGKHAGFLWSESGNFPAMGKEGPVHQVNFFKTAAAVGYQTFSTVWKSGVEGNGLPETPQEVALVNAEPAAFGAATGNNWLMRPHYIHQLPNGELCQEWKRHVDFIRRHDDLISGSKSQGEVALYLDNAQAEADFPGTYRAFLSLQQLLLQHHITFDLLFSGQENRFRDYPLILGTSTAHPEIMSFTAEELAGEVTGAYSAMVAPPKHADELARRVLDALPERELAADAPHSVFVERRMSLDGRNILHLVNYDNTHAVHNLRIRFHKSPEIIVRHSPEGNSSLRTEGNDVILPELNTWAILVWS